ncbi:MAG: mechanosensitive ion channel family protein, partial [Chloroflexi bacterium]|nr:mechanosensitive ion channel family protein [Chloroflexota bacterium]
MDFLQNGFMDNSYSSWLIAMGIGLGVFLMLTLLKRIFKIRLGSLRKITKNTLDDYFLSLLARTHWFSLLSIGLYLGSLFLNLPDGIQEWIDTGFRLIVVMQVGFWGSGLISRYVTQEVESRVDEDQGESASTVDALGLLGKIALWVILSLIILDNLNVEISALVTSLGIGGIAVALALQNILSDLFASMSITLDKPFVIGDFVVVDDFEGNVEDIGLKSTRIRSLSGEEVIFSNTDLLNSRIRNYRRLEKRRIGFSVCVTYGTAPELLQRIPLMMEEIISPIENAKFDRAHFKNLGDYALDFTVVYYV